MSIRRSFLGFGLAVGTASSALTFVQSPVLAQPPAGEGQGQAVQKKPADLFRQFRDLYLEGKFDVAAESLKDFLAAGPSDSELIEIDNRFGATFLLGLRNLPQWSDNPTANAAAKKALEELIAKTQAATKKLTQDPKRLSILIRNLGASPEERLYSEMEIKRAGYAAAAPMLEVLRSTNDIAQRAGILGAITKLNVDIVPPMIASLDGLSDDLKAGVVDAIGSRTDLLTLTSRTDTDPTPYFWYFASLPEGSSPSLRNAARKILETMYGSIEHRRSSDELVRLAKPITEKRSQYLGSDTAPGKIRLWSWDAGINNVKATDVTPQQADEWFALRTLKWAVERNPSDEATQAAFVGFAAQRAVERSNFDNLALSNPMVFSLLSEAPAELVTHLLEKGLRDKNSALAFAAIQTIGVRGISAGAESTKRIGGEVKPGQLIQALDFPDDRVQFAAAVALLRNSLTSQHGANARVIEILKRTAAMDYTPSTAPKAILADPATVRSAHVAEMYRQAGYEIESVSNTKDVLRRVLKASDIDLIIVDRHASSPMIRDFLAQLRALPSARSTPVFVVASTDRTKLLNMETLLLRLAILIAVTETEAITVPPAFAIDRRRPDKDNESIRIETMAFREKSIDALFKLRLGRLQRLVKASNFPDSTLVRDRLQIRLPQLTYAALAAEYPLTSESTPEAFKRFESLNKLIALQPKFDPKLEENATSDLIRIIRQLESILTPELQKKFDQISRAIEPADLSIREDSTRDAMLEDQLSRDYRHLPGVYIVAEPYSAGAVLQDVKNTDIPAAKSGITKSHMAKSAVEWLRRCAVGEIPGYDVRPAEGVLRSALRNDEVGEIALDAVARIGSAESQQDLITAALMGSRPAELRSKAADAAIRHIRLFGKLANTTQIDALKVASVGEKDVTIKSKLMVLSALFSSTQADFIKAIQGFSPQSIEAQAPKPAAPVAPAAKDPNAPPPAEGNPPQGNPKN